MKVHLVDGTYELFRAHFGAPPKRAPDGRQVGATAGMLSSLLTLITKSGATHIGCAFDHVVESFRNDLYEGYKTSEGVDQELLDQFPLAERAAAALGVVVWPMVEFEADDALASAAVRYQKSAKVEQVVLCSPDKDLAQLVRGDRIVCWDRRREIVYDEPAVIEKYGVPPGSIPDYLALVGDAADGYPGVSGWGAKSTAAVLAQFGHLESIPPDHLTWGLTPGRALRLAENLRAHQKDALLFRKLATLRLDVPIRETVAGLKWRGARPEFRELCAELGSKTLPDRVPRWIEG
jgi:5'-3' exonuclease